MSLEVNEGKGGGCWVMEDWLIQEGHRIEWFYTFLTPHQWGTSSWGRSPWCTGDPKAPASVSWSAPVSRLSTVHWVTIFKIVFQDTVITVFKLSSLKQYNESESSVPLIGPCNRTLLHQWKETTMASWRPHLMITVESVPRVLLGWKLWQDD